MSSPELRGFLAARFIVAGTSREVSLCSWNSFLVWAGAGLTPHVGSSDGDAQRPNSEGSRDWVDLMLAYFSGRSGMRNNWVGDDTLLAFVWRKGPIVPPLPSEDPG